ncbi:MULTISPECIES: CGNR zinc finger domain-containing protein [unclassified Paenibacillus]|uniref:CGNR zinc finger domain-containing protein n=1 Tax=unclassified Paenibacillus TaxID=185978 RepID=UPI002785F2F7|nr:MULTISPECIES: CGNR zinc finger domain-containing protein [unclassified Paenibacillus]MDQ0902018.1 putative RNA-binding Zn ribbon-like protein [Paenibacillus sp. V4I7]MDQ0919486.1 putative RNA-binding Zn ribbon-like protein [Paenibacillus sp. V4I5]
MLWDDFLKSDYHDWRGSGHSEDRLDKPGWLEQLLAIHNLPYSGAPSAEELDDLKRLRGHMLRIVQKLTASESADPADLEGLNRALSGGPIILRIAESDSGYRMESTPLRAGWFRIGAEVAASFGRILAEGEPSRLRICGNPDCLVVYYDETRNRSKRFCDDKVCGNLMKVRRFRARQKAAKTGGSSIHGVSET